MALPGGGRAELVYVSLLRRTSWSASQLGLGRDCVNMFYGWLEGRRGGMTMMEEGAKDGEEPWRE